VSPGGKVQSSGEQFGDDLGLSHAEVGQAVIAAGVRVDESLVVQPQGVQQRRLQIDDADLVLGSLIAKIVGAAVNVALLEATAGQPQREGVTVVIAAIRSL